MKCSTSGYTTTEDKKVSCVSSEAKYGRFGVREGEERRILDTLENDRIKNRMKNRETDASHAPTLIRTKLIKYKTDRKKTMMKFK